MKFATLLTPSSVYMSRTPFTITMSPVTPKEMKFQCNRVSDLRFYVFGVSKGTLYIFHLNQLLNLFIYTSSNGLVHKTVSMCLITKIFPIFHII